MAKDKSKFQLNKGANRGFDISKGGKRKFDLAKDVDDSVVTTTGSDGLTDDPDETSSKSRKIWLWVALVVVAALLAYLLWPKATTEGVEEQTIENATQPEDETADPVTDEATVSDVQEEADLQTEEAPEAESETASTETTATTAPEAAPTTTAPANMPTLDGVEAEALKVIRGDYGVGRERKDKLGSQYQAIQRRVNELKREGVF